MTLTERNIMESFIGKTVNLENLIRCAKKNRVTEDGIEYIVYIFDLLYWPELHELFGITDTLQERWEYSGTEFNMHVFLDGDIITKSFLDKLREVGGHGRPVIHILTPTQQELRVARRIMEYITS